MKNIIYILSFLLLNISLTSCFKKFEDMHDNPSFPDEATPESLFSNVIYSRIGERNGAHGEYFNLTGAGLWAQQFSKIQYIDEDWYQYRSNYIDNYWKNFYSGNSTTGLAGLYDLELALKSVRERKEFNSSQGNEDLVLNDEALEGAILVLRTYFFSVMTDVWGDIPYSESFQTKDFGFDQINTQPKYDLQRDIYTDFFERLEEANELLSKEGAIERGADLIYQGDVIKWRKFANSLAARLYLRISNVDASVARDGLSKLFNDPGEYPMFTSNEDDAELRYLAMQPYTHPFYRNHYLDGRDDFAISSTMVELLEETEDNRIHIFASPTPESINNGEIEYIGQENGVPRSETNGLLNTRSRIGYIFRDQPQNRSIVMSYAELLMIKAEAVLHHNVGGDVRSLVKEGIQASFAKNYREAQNSGAPIPVEIDEVQDAEIVFQKIDWNKEGGEERIILEQKFVAIFTNGAEAYAELRRTGWPKITRVRGAQIYQQGLPNRFPYPFSEQTTNSANLAEASVGIEETIYGKKIWFAENSEVRYK